MRTLSSCAAFNMMSAPGRHCLILKLKRILRGNKKHWNIQLNYQWTVDHLSPWEQDRFCVKCKSMSSRKSNMINDAPVIKSFLRKNSHFFSFFFMSEHLNQVFLLLSQVSLPLKVFVAAWWQFFPSAFLQPQFALQAEANRRGNGPLNGIITCYYDEKNTCLPQIIASWCQYQPIGPKIGTFSVRSIDTSLSIYTLKRRKLFTASDKKYDALHFI